MEFIGLDIGSQQCVVARSSGEIILNELGGMTTATLVSFKDKERLLGEAAVLASSTNPSNTVDYLNLLLGKTHADVEAKLNSFPSQRGNIVANAHGHPVAAVEYNGATTHFTPVQLMAMLLGKIGRNVPSTDVGALKLGIAIPSNCSADEKTALLQAAKIAGFADAVLVAREHALARCYHRKHPIKGDDEPSKTIVILDVGHVTTSAAVVRFTAQGEAVLATAYNPHLGSVNFERHLYAHFQAKLKASHGVDIKPASRQSRRLLTACEQLKKLLSTIPEAMVHAENLIPDTDITLSITKAEFEKLCSGEAATLAALLEGLLVDAAVAPADISTVEIVGGGTRKPIVQDAIVKAIGPHVILGRMLDSATAVAIGAAFAEDLATSFDVVVLDHEIALEREMQRQDEMMRLLANKRNEIETFVYEIRGKRDQKHGHLIDYAAVNPFLDAAEDWFYSDEADNATLDDATARVLALKTDIVNACEAYFAAVAKDEKELEAHLELESQKAALENKDDDDHDFRKLKTPDRMRLVVKNKDEGNELFKGGNVQHAAARYVKALTHATKFFDLRPDEAAEVKAIKLSLYLNLAQCYLKMESWQKAVVNCKDALDIDPSNTKALYRRALGYEKLKDFEAAFNDITVRLSSMFLKLDACGVQYIQEALRLNPEDKAIVLGHKRLDAYMKKQQEKEKKMWTKAFA
ncbi:Aste57867_19066 [Aphanomyces stellatus]|uniref:Aste57867_19066 protein n=1 Tax=Aphanomyces stellatus TaxID=120398 RepID=A0A485LDD8_9STRA|nr:hypothetical protein As57867_019002 [Aphanomyces stellatus]VFT95791.1 Aste57867_19066 [Aphanomyces stellatus]